jgi:hypothetical protein
MRNAKLAMGMSVAGLVMSAYFFAGVFIGRAASEPSSNGNGPAVDSISVVQFDDLAVSAAQM